MDCVGISSNIRCTRVCKQEPRDNQTFTDTIRSRLVREIMSLLSVHVEKNKPITKLLTKKSSDKHNYYAIMAITGIFLGVVLVSMLVLPLIIPESNGQAKGDLNTCRQKIIGAEQMGYYSSPEQFRLAESYCYMR